MCYEQVYEHFSWYLTFGYKASNNKDYSPACQFADESIEWESAYDVQINVGLGAQRDQQIVLFSDCTEARTNYCVWPTKSNGQYD